MGSLRSIGPEAPSIFGYRDYRTFLADHFAYHKSREPRFSLRVFARHPVLKLGSSSFLSAVLKGRKNLSQSLRLRFGKALGLTLAELEYFELLVQANQGKTAEERAHYQSRLALLHGSPARTLLESEHRFYARWWYPPVWHWIGLHPDQGNPARIAKAIRPRLEPAQAEEAIRVLLDLKLIKRLANGYAVTERHLAGGRGESARAYARDYLRLALDELDRPPAGAGDFQVWSFALSERGRERLREKLETLRAEVRELISREAGAEATGSEAAGAGTARPETAGADAAGREAAAPDRGARVYALALQLFSCSEGAGTPEALPARAAGRPGTSAEIAVRAG